METCRLLGICAGPNINAKPFEYCAMDPQRPLTSLSGKSIFGFLSLVKRQSLAKKCPSTRKWHRTLPFRFNKVDIIGVYDGVMIDDLKWTCDYYQEFNPNDSADEEANRNCPTKKFDADERIPLTITIPSGKKFFFENFDAFNRLINHYINRKGNKIRDLEIHMFWENMPELVGVKVRELTLRHGFHEEYGNKFLNSFKNNKFDKVWICGSGEDETLLVEQLKDMNIKNLELHIQKLGNQKIQDLDFERLVIMEGDYLNGPPSNGQLFLDRITPFIARSHDKTFEYLLDYLNPFDFDPKALVNLLKREWGAVHKYRNYSGMLAIDINDDWQVLIRCYLGQLGPWTGRFVALEATFLEKETLVPASQLSFHKIILRRMHIWQCSVTEFLKKSYRLAYFHHEHKIVAKCLYFLNNYHLRFITFLLFFEFFYLVFYVLSMLGVPLEEPLSFLASIVLAVIVNYLFLLPYQYDCRTQAVWDIAAE